MLSDSESKGKPGLACPLPRGGENSSPPEGHRSQKHRPAAGTVMAAQPGTSKKGRSSSQEPRSVPARPLASLLSTLGSCVSHSWMSQFRGSFPHFLKSPLLSDEHEKRGSRPVHGTGSMGHWTPYKPVIPSKHTENLLPAADGNVALRGTHSNTALPGGGGAGADPGCDLGKKDQGELRERAKVQS